MTTCVCCNGEAKYFAKYQNRNRIVRRFRCQRCRKTFSEKQPLDDLRIDHAKVVQIVKLLTEGLGVRAIARFVDCDPHTVLNVLETIGQKCEGLHDRIVRHVTTDSLQLDEIWTRVLQAHLRGLTISVPNSVANDPAKATNWVKAQLANRASQVTNDSYVGLFSSQQMVVQNRLTDPPLRQALAKNSVIQAKVSGNKIDSVNLDEISDDGLEELGLTLPCDDSQLRVVQLSHDGH